MVQEELPKGRGLGHAGCRPCFVRRYLVVREKLQRASALIDEVLKSPVNDHRNRIKWANQAKKFIDDFIATEVQAAVNEPKSSVNYMSWQQIGETLGISKTAAYMRYGQKENERQNVK